MNDDDDNYQIPIRDQESFNNHKNGMQNYQNRDYSDSRLDESNMDEGLQPNNQNQPAQPQIQNQNSSNQNQNQLIMAKQQQIQQNTHIQRNDNQRQHLQNFLNQNLSIGDVQQNPLQQNYQQYTSGYSNINQPQNLNMNNGSSNQIAPNNNYNNRFTPQQFQNQQRNNNNNNHGNGINFPQEISPILNNTRISAGNAVAADQSFISNNRRASNGAASLSVSGFGPDPRKNDIKYACLLIKRLEFFCSKENLEKHSHYLSRVFEKQEQSFVEATRNAQVRIKLPDNTKPDVLIMFIDYIDRGKELPDKIDLYIAQNVLTIAEALKMRQIQKKFLMTIIMPMLNRENVIFFVKMAYGKLSDEKEQEELDQNEGDGGDEEKDELESTTTHKEEEYFWVEFLSYSLDLAAANIQYILKKKSVELNGVLEASVIDEIIERAIKFYRADLQYDNSLLFETLMKIRGCDSIFQLLDQEKKKLIENEDTLLKSGVKPTLTWKVQNLSGNFYRESDGFWVENAQWKLVISYFSTQENALNVQLKMITNPFDVKNNKDYFKKKEFFLPSNMAGFYNHNPIDDFEEYELKDEEEINQRRKQIEKANAEYPTHSYISIVSTVKISNEEEEQSDPQIQTLICSSKAPALLRKILEFYPEDYDSEVTIEIYFKLKYTYSAILHYITRNFTHLITDPIIYLLPKDQFKLILKHKFLFVTQEDEVVKALCLWLEGQEPTEALKWDLAELLENVQWNYVSIACLLDIVRNFSAIRRHESFKKILQDEFNLRLKFKADQTKLQPPRFCYKYNKTQTNPEAVSKNSKNANALLFINHEDFFQKLLDHLVEPVDLIRSHLVNEGVSESGHRKQLELQLQKKQKEMQEIQEQLNNMKLAEDMNDQSRSNSRLNRNNTHSRMNHRSSYGDDQETVKNSMINLLNVIDGGDPNGANNAAGGLGLDSTTQQQNNGLGNQTNNAIVNTSNFGEHLRNVSNEFVKKMQLNLNQVVQSPFEIYENQQQPGRENKVRILYQSVSDEEQEQINQDVQFTNNKNAAQVNIQDTQLVVAGGTGPLGGDESQDQNEGYEDDEEDDDEQEEEKEVFNAENLKSTANQRESKHTQNKQSLYTYSAAANNLNNPQLTNNMSQELNQFQPDHSNQQFNHLRTDQIDDIQSFHCNSIVVGGGIVLTSSNNPRQGDDIQGFKDFRQEVIVNEHKEIQTSINLILTANASKKALRAAQSSQESARCLQESQRISSQHIKTRNQQVLLKDQSIQMSLPSQREKGLSIGLSLGFGQMEQEFLQNENKKVYVDAAIQFEDIFPIQEEEQESKPPEHFQIIRTEDQEASEDREQEVSGNNYGIGTGSQYMSNDIERENQSNQSSKDLQQSQVLTSSQRERTQQRIITQSRQGQLQNRNNSVDIEQEEQQRYMIQNIFSTRQQEQQNHGHNLKQKQQNLTHSDQNKYLKGIQDYTNFVQQLSKDAFDTNFLDQFIGGQNNDINGSFPVSMDNRTFESKQQAKILTDHQPSKQNYSSGKTSQLHSTHSQTITGALSSSNHTNNNYSNYINQSHTSSTVQSSFQKLRQFQNIKSPKATGGQNLSQSQLRSKNNYSQTKSQQNQQLNLQANNPIQQAVHTQNTNDSKSQLNESYNQQKNAHQRARSQLMQRGSKVHQKRLNQASKVGNTSNLNKSAIQSTATASLSNYSKPQYNSKNQQSTTNQFKASSSKSRQIATNSLAEQKYTEQKQFKSQNMKQSNNNAQASQIIGNARNSKIPVKAGQLNMQGINSNRVTSAPRYDNLQQFDNQGSRMKQQYSIPTSTKNSKNILSLQKLLEGSNQNLVNMNFGAMTSDMNITESFFGWNNTQELNFSSPLQPPPQSNIPIQQNFITNQIHMNDINNPMSFDITAQIANYNILEQIQKQQAVMKKQFTNSAQMSMPLQNQAQFYMNQALINKIQSPSSSYQQNLNNIFLDISNAKLQGHINSNTNLQNGRNFNQLGTIEEAKTNEIITSADNRYIDDGQRSLHSSTYNQQPPLSSLGGTQNTQQLQLLLNSNYKSEQNLLSQIISPQNNTQSVYSHNINLNLLNQIQGNNIQSNKQKTFQNNQLADNNSNYGQNPYDRKIGLPQAQSFTSFGAINLNYAQPDAHNHFNQDNNSLNQQVQNRNQSQNQVFNSINNNRTAQFGLNMQGLNSKQSNSNQQQNQNHQQQQPQNITRLQTMSNDSQNERGGMVQ